MRRVRLPASNNRVDRAQATKEKFAQTQLERRQTFRAGVPVCYKKDKKTQIGEILQPPARHNMFAMVRLLSGNAQAVEVKEIEVFQPATEVV